MAFPITLSRQAVASTSRVRLCAPRHLAQCRCHSSSAAASVDPTTLASYAYTNPATSSSASSAPTPALPPHQRDTLSSLLRVDHSGEIAANTIYAAQAKVFEVVHRDAAATRLMLEMWDNEKKHLRVAEMLLSQHRVRPSLLNPLWGTLGTMLGASTALMGKEAAMACTEAVETVIGEHYDDQISHLDDVLKTFRQGVAEGEVQGTDNSVEARNQAGAQTQTSLHKLRDLLEEFRDDELEHLDTAVEHDAQQAPAHALLSAVVGWGCKGAIEVAKRI